KYGVDFSFRIFTRPAIIYKDGDRDDKNAVMRQLLLRLKEAGLVKVFIGVEAGNSAQLKRYRRGLSLKETMRALEILNELQIGIDSGFIMFDAELTVEEMLENLVFFRANRLMPYNQWPFRPLAVNEGARIVQGLAEKGLLGKTNINFIDSKYTFKDKDIEKIAKIVDEVSVKTRTVFYALKTKSKKYFDPRKKDAESVLSQAYIEENGHIYLDLMEDLGQNIRTATDKRIEGIVKEADKMAMDLARRVAEDIDGGRINDDEGYIAGELAKIGINVGFKRIGVDEEGSSPIDYNALRSQLSDPVNSAQMFKIINKKMIIEGTIIVPLKSSSPASFPREERADIGQAVIGKSNRLKEAKSRAAALQKSFLDNRVSLDNLASDIERAKQEGARIRWAIVDLASLTATLANLKAQQNDLEKTGQE
ncbi:MAG: hypothetical protein AABZ57_07545, partial [Candidatus Margulisiibacteriota bacterium]